LKKPGFRNQTFCGVTQGDLDFVKTIFHRLECCRDLAKMM
jgi:hypothetical protein